MIIKQLFPQGIHKEQLNFLKKIGERKYLETHTPEEYMKRYKVNYLEEDELVDITMAKIEKEKNGLLNAFRKR